MNSRVLPALLAAVVASLAYYLGTRQAATSPTVATAPAAIAPAPRPGLAAILAETDPLRHRVQFAQWLTALTADEATNAARQVWAQPGDLSEITERKKLFSYAWGQVSGAAAIEFARTQPGSGKVAALGAALAGWASKDPAAAQAWISARLDPGEQLMYSWALVEGWARHDPASATAYALSRQDDPNTGRYVQSIALEQVRRDAPAASAWALALPAGSLRVAAVEEVATHWSRTAPQAAAQWARSLPDNGLAIPALRNVTTEWARADSLAAGTWLNGMDPSARRDQAVAAYCQVLAAQELDHISRWAQTISDSKLREQSLLNIAEEWMGRNPEAALAWLPQSGLSPARIAQLSRPNP